MDRGLNMNKVHLQSLSSFQDEYYTPQEYAPLLTSLSRKLNFTESKKN